MILSTIQELKNKTQTNAQRILCKCDDCQKIWECYLGTYYSTIKQYGRDLCRGCKQKELYKLGIRNSNFITQYNKQQTGLTTVERLGEEKAKLFKIKRSLASKGKNNPNFKGTWRGINPAVNQKGKTFEEIYGKEKAKNIKNKISLASKGERNPMFGKPSPQGSGNGWSGWYKNWYFRSLLELSFMINVIERFNFEWRSAETAIYKINYEDWNGTKRTYHPDFILSEKYLIEIKPKHLWNSETVKRKIAAANIFCNSKNLKFKITSCTKLLTHNEIEQLIKEKQIKFIKRYQIKWETLKLLL